MRELKLLNSDLVAYVDDEDYDFLSKFEWKLHGAGYPTVMMTLHRFLLGKQDGKLVIDHINRNKLDNRRENLRICGQLENTQNRDKKSNTSSKYKGVSWSAAKKKWIVHVYYNKECVYNNQFDDEDYAGHIYDLCVYALYGKYCYLNFPENTYNRGDFLEHLKQNQIERESKRYSTVTGVTFFKNKNNGKGVWVARDTRKGQRKTFGTFNTKEEAEECAIKNVPQSEPIKIIKLIERLLDEEN